MRKATSSTADGWCTAAAGMSRTARPASGADAPFRRSLAAAARGRERVTVRAADLRGRHVPAVPPARRTARAGRLVMIASTPRSSSRCIVGSSSTVHTCTGRRDRCAARTKRSVTIGTPWRRIGTCRQSAPCRRMRPVAVAASTARAVASGPIDVHARPRPSARTRAIRSSENAPMQTRSQASSRSISATSGSTQPSVFGSMFTSTSGQRARISSSRGTLTPRPRKGNVPVGPAK